MIHVVVCSNSDSTQKELLSSLLEMEQKLKITLDIVSVHGGNELCQILLRQQAHLANPDFYKAGSGQKIYNRIEYTRIDLLFLDIELPDINGIVVADFIRKRLEIADMQIVFMADREDYAMQLFAYQPLDFKIKPIKTSQMEEIMKNYTKYVFAKRIRFIYKKEKYFKQVPYGDIMYFISDSRKIRIVCQDYEDTFYGKLCDIRESLPSEFLQIHKSYIINCRYVKTFHCHSVILENNQTLSISKPYRETIRNMVKEIKK